MRMIEPRRGAIVPLTAFLLVFLIGMVAFAVDIGWIVVVKSDLQNAADAAALAGANSMIDSSVQYNSPNQTAAQKSAILASAKAAAQAKAKEYAKYNGAGGVASLELLDSDIEFGFTDAANKYTPAPTFTGFPNTVKATLRRDGTANTPVKLFFGQVLGVSNTSLTATAAATLYGGVINSFIQPKSNVGMLPVTYDVNHWKEFLKTGKGPDATSLLSAAGNPVIQIYPSLKFKGNFGQISLNDSHVGQSTESAWVTGGVPPSDINTLISHNLVPLSSHNPALWDWQGNTGMKASLISTMNGEVGNTFLIPLFKPAVSGQVGYQAGVGQGSNYFYNVVEFVGVRIMPTSDTNKELIVEPAAVIEPNAIFDAATIAPIGTSTTLVTTYTTPKLSQ